MRRQTTSLERAPSSNPFSTLSFVEMHCFNCGTSEDRRDDAADFKTWYARWQAS